MSQERRWLSAIAVARAAGSDTWAEGGLTVRRVAGGFNNALGGAIRPWNGQSFGGTRRWWG